MALERLIELPIERLYRAALERLIDRPIERLYRAALGSPQSAL